MPSNRPSQFFLTALHIIFNMSENAHRTPEPLIKALQIDHMMFNQTPNNISSLTNFVNQTSKQYRCPMSAFITGIDRVTQIYCCRFGGRVRGINSAKSYCEAYVKFVREDDGSFSFKEANWEHNYKVDIETFESHFCTCTNNELNEIKAQQELGVAPAQIRTNLDIRKNSRNYYYHRCSSSNKFKKESLDEFLEKCSFPDFHREVSTFPDGSFACATFINKEVAISNYSSDTYVIDDTAKTNLYDLPVEVIIVIDEENKSQILSFSFLQDRTSIAYKYYFETVKQFTKNEPRTIVSDRSMAQLSACEEVFPNSIVVYCRVHLRRDLLKYFEATDDIIAGFDDIFFNISRCDEYINLLQIRITQMEEESSMLHKSLPPGHEILQAMIKNVNHWLPSKLIESGIYLDWNTNRAEGFFGNFKQHFGFKLFTLTQLCLNIVQFSRLKHVNSKHSVTSTINFYKTFPTFTEEDLQRVGKLALDIMSQEYHAAKNEQDNSPWCVWCILREKNPKFSLPCRHIYHENSEIVIQADTLHPRFLRTSIEIDQKEENETIHIIQQNKPKTYTDIMAKLSPYASAACRNQEIMTVFDNTFDQLSSITKNLNSQMPPTIESKGRFSIHPSQNVILGGAPKQKNLKQCSLCKQYGHNKRSCPLNK